MASVLTINGSTVSRAAARVVLNRLSLSMDGPDGLEFTEVRAALPGTYRQGQPVTLTVDGTLVFSGVITGLFPANVNRGRIDVGYRAMGLAYQANQVWLAGPDGSGRIAFNLPPTDPDYVPNYAGLSVGQMLVMLYSLNAAALAAVGVGAFTSAGTGGAGTPVISGGAVTGITLAAGGSGYTTAPTVYVWGGQGSGASFTASVSGGAITGFSSASGGSGYSSNAPPLVIVSTLPATTLAELLAISVVPTEPVELTGRTWNAATSLLAAWCNKYLAWIQPDGTIRHPSALTGLTSRTLTLDSDPVTLDDIAEDFSECYTQVVCRGGAWVEGAYLSLVADVTLLKAWSGGQESSWTYTKFLRPTGAYESGNVSGMTSTTLSVTATDPASISYGANYWGPLAAEVWAYNPAATGITFIEQRRIVSSTAPSGNAYTITVDQAFGNSGYTKYQVRGLGSFMASTSDSLVWRKFNIKSTYVARHLVKRFSHSVPWSGTDGVLVQTTDPMAVVCFSQGGQYVEWPMGFSVIPSDGTNDGYILFDQPICTAYAGAAALAKGGSAIPQPTEVKALVPYSRGAITAQAPSGGGYQGTAYTVNGVQRTLYRDFPGWLDYRDSTAYAQLAQEILDTVKNTVIEGSITYWGKLSWALALGSSLNLAGNGYSTGHESMAAAVRGVVLDYLPGGGASPWVTRVRFSTRLRPFCGDRLYAHPAWGQAPAMSGAGFGSAAAIAASSPAMAALRAAGTDPGAAAAGAFGTLGQAATGSFDRAASAAATNPSGTLAAAMGGMAGAAAGAFGAEQGDAIAGPGGTPPVGSLGRGGSGVNNYRNRQKIVGPRASEYLDGDERRARAEQAADDGRAIDADQAKNAELSRRRRAADELAIRRDQVDNAGYAEESRQENRKADDARDPGSRDADIDSHLKKLMEENRFNAGGPEG